MPVCLKCKRVFPIHVRINGETKNLCSRKYCLDCSPYGSRNTSNKLQLIDKLGLERVCAKCKIKKSITEFYARKDSNRKIKNYSWCKQCTNEDAKERLRTSKARMVEYKGGKCVICGYSNYQGALDFHHLDPKQKDFTISHSGRYDFEKTKIELDKCILVCSNCHKEIHANLIDLSVYV